MVDSADGGIHGGGRPMAIPGGGSVRISSKTGISVLVVVCIPMVSFAGWPAERGDTHRGLRRGPGVANHPVGVVPSSAVTIPEGWPLVDGKLTCRTCHSDLPSSSRGTGATLREFGGDAFEPIEFCATCHSEADVSSAASMHWTAVGVAHVKADRSSTSRSRGVLDEGSARCLACHDGVNASEARFETSRTRRVGFSGDPGRNHPIGVPYPRSVEPGRDSRYRPASLLPEEVRLPGGKVSCVSCHNLYATDRARLAVPIEGSKLCFTCHEMG